MEHMEIGVSDKMFLIAKVSSNITERLHVRNQIEEILLGLGIRHCA